MIFAVDLVLFQSVNALVGRSFTLDALMALALDSAVLKGGPVAACFMFAWWHGAPGQRQSDNRRTLLLTLCALFVVAPVMKIVSTTVPISPRPLVAAEHIFVLKDGAMVASGITDFRVPATGLAADLSQKAAEGTIAGNDLASFPSDHAALFAAFAGGIFLALRAAGLAASIWAILGIFLPRVATGLHWPSDIIAGALAGLVILAIVMAAGRSLLDRQFTWLVALAERHPAWSQAIIMLVLFEAAGAMTTLSRFVELAKGVTGI
jgi:undecaprenyl-diphosphatase